MQIDREPFYAGGLGAPPAIAKLVHAARDEVDILADALRQSGETASAASSLTAFVDPIDGTKEFSTGKGEQCTICIGFADADGAAVAGVVYRPLDGPSPTWALGCASEGYAREQLRPREGSDRPRGLLCSNGGRSDFLRALASQVRRARAHLQRARPPRSHLALTYPAVVRSVGRSSPPAAQGTKRSASWRGAARATSRTAASSGGTRAPRR